MFLLNSRSGYFSAPAQSFCAKRKNLERGGILRTYPTNLPSSLAKVLSITCGYSPRQPVSVYGTDLKYIKILEAFLGNLTPSTPSWINLKVAITTCIIASQRIYQLRLAYCLDSDVTSELDLSNSVPPSTRPRQRREQMYSRYRNINRLSIDYPPSFTQGLALGPTNPSRMYLERETFGIR